MEKEQQVLPQVDVWASLCDLRMLHSEQEKKKVTNHTAQIAK